MKYFIADTHFFHRNIIRLNPHKRKEGFEDLILSNLERLLTPQDELFIVGDFLWEFREDFLLRWKGLPGKKFLVKGNHDSRVRELPLFFDEIFQFYHLVEVGEKRLLLCHYPSKDLRTYRFIELQKRVTGLYFELNADLLIHGHVHWNPFCVFCGRYLNCVKCLNVNCEFTGFKPVSERELPLW